MPLNNLSRSRNFRNILKLCRGQRVGVRSEGNNVWLVSFIFKGGGKMYHVELRSDSRSTTAHICTSLRGQLNATGNFYNLYPTTKWQPKQSYLACTTHVAEFPTANFHAGFPRSNVTACHVSILFLSPFSPVYAFVVHRHDNNAYEHFCDAAGVLARDRGWKGR